MHKSLFALLLPLSFAVHAASSCDEFFAFGYPTPPTSSKGDATELCRISYFVLHDNNKKIPFYAAELLLPENVGLAEPRSNDFTEDKSVPQYGRSTLKDYSGSGYDRGHVAPANDMRPGTAAMSQSFYLSNMVPQVPSINRGVWKKLELQVVKWVKSDRELYVITGPLTERATLTIGKGVVIPTHMYKVVVDRKNNDATAFVIPNYLEDKKLHSNLSLYRWRISDVEKIVGFSFFPDASPDLRTRLSTSDGKSFRLENEVHPPRL